MNISPHRRARNPVRVWFEESNFDAIAEPALSRCGLLPAEPGPVDIELFVELEFDFHVTFRAMPAGRHGWTSFSETGPAEIAISEHLDRPHDRNLNRQCRAVIAHECGHALQHEEHYTELWKAYRRWREAGRDDASFAASIHREQSVRKRLEEIQACRLSACLLIPRSLLQRVVEATAMADKPAYLWSRSDLEVLTYHVSDTFDVSRALAERRLRTFYGLPFGPVPKRRIPLPCPILVAAPRQAAIVGV